jgi:hypothetical protein
MSAIPIDQDEIDKAREIIAECRAKAEYENDPNWKRCWLQIADDMEAKLQAQSGE